MSMADKTLFICEKPSVARDLAAALGESFKRSSDGTHLESERFVVSWAIGHLLRLYNPDEYQEAWKRWRLEDLPLRPEEFKLKPASSKTRSQLQALKKLLGRADVSLVVNACDAGREGELIFRYIVQYAKARKPVKRLWLASLTADAIREGLASMRDGAEYDALADAARSRSEADWLVGMNASRAATLILRDALGGTASVGRVQTPTLALLVRRELEIRTFKTEDYWIVEATFATVDDGGARRYVASYEDGKRLPTAAQAETVVEAVHGRQGLVSKVERSRQQVKPPQLYDLTALQREASTAWGWTAATTLQVAQRLYEHHKLITYPRTDSRWLTSDQGAALPALLRALGAISAYAPHVARLEEPLALKQVVNDSKVKDHYAIIPTDRRPPTDISKDEAALYGMIARRLLAALHPAAVLERTRVETTVADHRFVAKGKVVIEPGWRAVYDGVGWFKSDEQELPALSEGEAVDTVQVEAVAKQTQPPKRYSDAGLLGAMETAGKLVEDEAAREAMKESGLGTPATRAAIIERLIAVEYVRRERKALVPTEKGVGLIELLGDHPLASPSLTGEWERRLGLIEAGSERRAAFMTDLDAFTQQAVDRIVGLREQVAHLSPADERETLAPCPSCGKPIREGPKSYSCWTRSDPGCGLTIWKTISGRTLPAAAVMQLLTAGQTDAPVEGFRSKAGKEFSARLKLERQDNKWRVAFVFD